VNRTLLPLLLWALLLAACAGGDEGRAAARADTAAASTPAGEPTPEEPPAAPAAEAAPDPPALDSAAVAEAIAEDDALTEENRRTFEQRRRSMSGYAQCMAQARDLPPAARERIEAACARARGAP
jgi:hypothetical protein